MENMVKIYKEDYCMDCNTEHALAIYDIFSNKINMSDVIQNPSIISRRNLSYIKCKNCNREYNIDWSSDSRIPRPLITNIELNNFLSLFRQNSSYILYRR